MTVLFFTAIIAFSFGSSLATKEPIINRLGNFFKRLKNNILFWKYPRMNYHRKSHDKKKHALFG